MDMRRFIALLSFFFICAIVQPEYLLCFGALLLLLLFILLYSGVPSWILAS